MCVPDLAFVKRMCNGSFPDVALVLMAKDAPFTRMYMKGDVDGWNADGGASARARLRFDEEMLVLRRRTPPAGGIVVGSGGAGYLVMRWDGNCYTLEDAELTTKKPAAPEARADPVASLLGAHEDGASREAEGPRRVPEARQGVQRRAQRRGDEGVRAGGHGAVGRGRRGDPRRRRHPDPRAPPVAAPEEGACLGSTCPCPCPRARSPAHFTRRVAAT